MYYVRKKNNLKLTGWTDSIHDRDLCVIILDVCISEFWCLIICILVCVYVFLYISIVV